MTTSSTYTPSTSFRFPEIPQATMQTPTISGHARLTYFLTRGNGHPVPLVPADELPSDVQLQGVPRVLTSEQTCGLQYIGTAPHTGATFMLERGLNGQLPNSLQQIKPPSSAPIPSEYSGPATFARQDKALTRNISSSSNVPQTMLRQHRVTASDAAISWRKSRPTLPVTLGTDGPNKNIVDTIPRLGAGVEKAKQTGHQAKATTPPPPSGKIPDPKKKEYCTYWILHGDCAYVQQGCLYKHEMPSKAKLQEIGIWNIPRWWVERNAVANLRGGKATVGRKMKPKEWMKAKKSQEVESDESESGSEYSNTAVKPTEGRRAFKSTQTKKALPKALSVIQTKSAPAEQSAKAPCEQDLIEFYPLIPTPSTIVTTTATDLETSDPEELPKSTIGSSNRPEAERSGSSTCVSPARPTIGPTGGSPVAHSSGSKTGTGLTIEGQHDRIDEARHHRNSKVRPKRGVRASRLRSPDKKGQENQDGRTKDGLFSSKHAPRQSGDEIRSAQRSVQRVSRPRRPAAPNGNAAGVFKA